MNRNLIVKDNALINAAYYLDLVEQRLVLLAIIEIRKQSLPISADIILSISAESYATIFDVKKNAAYEALKSASKSLFERRFSFKETNANGNLENVTSRWVSEIRYVENEACVKLIFAPAVIPLVTSLEAYFTRYDLEQVKKLTSGYAIRLYELVIAWRTTGKVPKLTVKELRAKLGVANDEYQKMSNFKSRVLDSSITQINERTDIKIDYEQEKSGRNVTGFLFSFEHKAPCKDVEPSPLLKPLTARQIEYFAKQLSQDTSFGSQFAHAGETSQAFTQRLTQELQQTSKQVEWQKWIAKYDKMSKTP